jgi:hypothetical protein
MQRVPGGHKEALWESEGDGEWVPTVDVFFRSFRYRIERLAAEYRAGKELVIVES